MVYNDTPASVMALKKSGIKTPADFKGKTLGVWFGGNEYPFLSWMSTLGLKTDGSAGGVKVSGDGIGDRRLRHVDDPASQLRGARIAHDQAAGGQRGTGGLKDAIALSHPEDGRTLFVISPPGKGTLVTAQLPLSPA